MIIKGFVYILEMINGRYYIGSSKNVKRRFDEHNRGLVKSTKNNRPLKLLFVKEFETYDLALKKELSLKKQKDRKAVERFMAL
ncbi:MAG TPA: GIY-YIG nuclease family protein [Candidatus Absconditabacterales bacterium]|nr:GIY-YIG nuclease family protein [Candidatus Absconditabacterales bacterium]